MRTTVFCGLFLVLLTFVVPVSAQQPDTAVAKPLFESQSLADWDFFVAEVDVKKEDVFSFTKEGTLLCKGLPFGWLCTKEIHKNFKVELEYRWVPGEKPTNSGIFLRMNEKKEGSGTNSFLPRAVEVQLQNGNAGDIWAFHGMNVLGSDDRFTERPDGGPHGKVRGVKRIQSKENEPSQWNRIEILCSEGLIVVNLNGTMVNWTLDFEKTPGTIGLQSEGGPIEFRNMMLTILP